MALYSQEQIEEVRSRADIVEIIGTHVQLRRAGRNFTGLCPFHNEKTPSFSVNPERGFFHCFGCGVGGSVFDFVMRMDALTFPEAVQTLARRYGVALPQPTAGPGTPSPGERDALGNANQIAADFYSHVLWNTPDGATARDYLKSRGISLETAKSFKLGFAPARPTNLAAALYKRGLTSAGIKVGLLKQDGRGGSPYDMFRARLMFPIRDAQGRVVAFGGRVLDERLPKYINSPESPIYSKARTVYGLNEARQPIAKADRALIVEGYIDVIALAQAGFKEVVASLGTSLTVEQIRLLSRYTRNLIACFDGDNAGRKASMRALDVFLEAGMLGRGAFIPQGFDPDTLVRQHGAQAFEEILNSAMSLVDFFFDEEVKWLADNKGLDREVESAKRVADKLRLIRDEQEFNQLVSRAVSRLRLDVQAEAELRNFAVRNRPAVRRAHDASAQLTHNRTAKIDAGTQAKLGLCALALLWPDLRAEIGSRLDFPNADNAISALAEGCRAQVSNAALEAVVIEHLSGDQRTRLSELMVGPLLADETKKRMLMEDYLNALVERQRRDQLRDLRRAAAGESADPLAATAAAQEVITLRRQGGRQEY